MDNTNILISNIGCINAARATLRMVDVKKLGHTQKLAVDIAMRQLDKAEKNLRIALSLE